MYVREITQKGTKLEEMRDLRIALSSLEIPTSLINAHYAERSISFRDLTHRRCVKIDCYNNVFIDLVVNGCIKSEHIKCQSRAASYALAITKVKELIANEEKRKIKGLPSAGKTEKFAA